MTRKPHPQRPPRNDLVDALVLEVHGLVHDQGWLADRALERVLRRERALWANERRAVAEAVYGILRSQGQLDFLLGGSPPLATRYAAWLVRGAGVGPAQAAARLGAAPRALAGLAEADARIAAIADPLDRFAVEASLPRWIAERLVSELGEAEARALAAVLNRRAPLTVRANALAGDREALRAALAAEGVPAEQTRFSPWGLTLDGHQNAFALEAFRTGGFEIQDEGSQLIALACGARPGQVVVDACAGAGGKSLALAAEMHNKGSLHALDSDAGRLEDARRRARRAHVHNLRTRVLPAGPEAEAALTDLAGKADVVLVDAPCSGLGTLRRKPDARWRLQPGDPERFAAIQRELLGRFARLARPGGRIVYATCAMGRTENDDVADFAERELGLAPAPLAPFLGAERARALGASESRCALYPHRHGTDGFFFAAFAKRA
ncbi:RsmB/NOP family class I SAM-dependent RNA methyltransferase [Anaeromyxobacter dehalogenans]|uniref:Methyltransferase n=1 Tax=Anaeromyxobacter dehalogenans (strain 2CP-C) TaxID=290397 RepID=Q2IML6_ANADE|nr:methyltransferase domain-containing protein [Anaeromyxobacter dehalogenans]ABC80052.1 methyltransferase [Anaeromyxobacter dehalogenans 2CP-C]